MIVLKIIHNNVIAKLHEPDEDARVLVQDILSYQVPGAEHMAGTSWDGVSSMFERKTNQFPAGFVRFVKKRLEKKGYRIKTVSKPAVLPLGPKHPVVDDFGFVERYDYQAEIPETLVSNLKMIAQVATGGGKSRIFKLCAKRINRPTLFLTTRKTLMYQMADNYQESFDGEQIGILGDGVWKPHPTGTNFAIVDTLISRLTVKTQQAYFSEAFIKHTESIEKAVVEWLKLNKLPFVPGHVKKLPIEVRKKIDAYRQSLEEKSPFDKEAQAKKALNKENKQNLRRSAALDLLGKIEFVCLEEAHEVSGNSFFEIMNNCVNADYRLALTATPFMKDSDEANMRLMAASGPIGVKVSEKLLIDRGILAKPYFRFAKTARPTGLFASTKWQRAYKLGIIENAARNNEIVTEAKKAAAHNLPTLVLVQRKDHGEALLKLLQANGLKAKFIFGDNEQTERKAALDQLGAGEVDVLIGTTIVDVGVDVPSVGLVVLAGGGKAETQTRQRIGRGLREKKQGANVCFVLDFADDFNNTLREHFYKRLEIIQGTPGFDENIVDQFDYSIITKAAA